MKVRSANSSSTATPASWCGTAAKSTSRRNSKNGTYVGDLLVSGRVRLNHGDEIRTGSVVRVHLECQ
jgi:hypothetical protein